MVMFVRLLYAQLLKTSGKESNTMIKTTRMFKPLLRGAILLLAFAAVGQAAAQGDRAKGDPGDPPKDPPKPTVKEQCFDDGWKKFRGFKNQGDCVSFVATKGKNPPAKAPPPSSAPRSKGKSSDTPPGTSSGK